MIKVASTKIRSKYEINCLLFDRFIAMRRVRQKCTLSMLLYIIATEVLANFIDKD